MSSSGDVMIASAIAIAILMASTWLVSVVAKNASIVDIVWGLGFVLVGWVSFGVGDGDDTRDGCSQSWCRCGGFDLPAIWHVATSATARITDTAR